MYSSRVSVLKRRADVVGVLEAMYAPEPDGLRWSRQFISTIQANVATDLGIGMLVVGHQADLSKPVVIDSELSSGFLLSHLPLAQHMVETMTPEVFRTLFYPGPPVASHRELLDQLPPGEERSLRAFDKQMGWRDALGFFGYPEPGVASVVFIGLDRQRLDAREQSAFLRFAGHFDSALRMRMRPELAVAAVIAPDGSFRDLADPSLAKARREWFGDRVTEIEASRTRASGRDDIQAWWALFDGRYSVVPLEESDGKRHYLLVNNPPVAEKHAKFTAREIEVVRMASRGFTSKSVAYNLGIAEGSVSQALGSAARKLGLSSRLDLLRVAGALFGVPATSIDVKTLTAAERDVLDLLHRGLSNAQIARLRKRSLNTVKNQLASLLRKTASPSRRALALTQRRE